jgi:hypothetical protein
MRSLLQVFSSPRVSEKSEATILKGSSEFISVARISYKKKVE